MSASSSRFITDCSSNDDNFIPPQPPEVVTPSGRLQGQWAISYEGRTYAAFEGIPYAQPPVGELRFEVGEIQLKKSPKKRVIARIDSFQPKLQQKAPDPKPFGTWLGRWQASHTYSCLQPDIFPGLGETAGEDCLYLNVYVPTDTMDHHKKIDVIVYIHGGAFTVGSGRLLQPQFVIDTGLIFVTFNYRLGILGFLSTQDEVLPGNYGMKDQVLALKWVKENIASFGGNPESVTITGLSAGGASVHLHYFSPLSRGLFVRGRNASERARKLGVLLKCDDKSSEELKKCLKQKPAKLILETQDHFYAIGHDMGRLPFSPFAPVIETKSKNPFLSEELLSLLREGKVLDAPWIVSTCADEGLYPIIFYYSEMDKLDNEWANSAQHMLDYNYTLPEFKREEVAKQIKDFYLTPHEKISKANVKKMVQAIRFIAPKEEELEGVSHGEDMLYFYGFPGLKDFSEEDNKLMNTCQHMLHSYATTGIPSFSGTNVWLPTKHSQLTYLNITDANDITLQTVDSLTPTAFWRSIGLLEYEIYSGKTDLKNSSSDEDVLPKVKTRLGELKGTWRFSVSGKKFASFESVPYAQPPIGDLRFEDPVPVKPWRGSYFARGNHKCVQDISEKGEEDCLYLNVYVPTEEIDPSRNLDVVVVIHGGAFMAGSSYSIKPAYIMDNDIILVTINYRLGIFGFLSTGDDVLPGNYGLKDQTRALIWVKRNIGYFGGNNASVTIAGVCSGGASVHLHYLSPLSKGMFVRGLSHSGNALDPWVFKRNPYESARRLAEMLECNHTTTTEIKACLKTRPAYLILQKQGEFYGYDQMPVTPFGPVVEPESKKAFLTKDPYALLAKGSITDAPWIVSTCTHGGLSVIQQYYADPEELDTDWVEFAHYFLDYNDTLPKYRRENVANKIKDFYLGPGEHINKENFNKTAQMFTDRLYLIGAETAAKLQSKINKSPVYYYVFNHRKIDEKRPSTLPDGVLHGTDGIFLYGFGTITIPKAENRTVKMCQDMLYSYVTTGKPSFDGTDKWRPTKHTELTYLNVTNADDIKLQTKKSLVPLDFWRSLGFMERENLFRKDELYQDAPQVKTWLGKIRGSWKTSYDGRTYAAFEGIPYAKPPIEDLRFEV
ncbi:hypothetical protein NQ318_008410 [Aromia moschata]|uniref:Carboxylesterase type B domain-containing protein n=1 Tax=Aromia moschata TaxID=1265417 RepID=A0AAV8X5A0_9CUCU|nr:hypothetical protein NQ318_008410 [Aromia moschata]